MRNAYAKELEQIARQDKRVVLLSGDIGNRMFDSYQNQFPERFYNCGIAESSMMSIAAGLALNGFRPFVYTITPFTTLRCMEQIKIDVCYHEAPVTIVGTGSGLSYAQLGPTHHSLDDIGAMRLLPKMNVYCPCDPIEVKLGLRAILQQSQPTYVRLGKKGEPNFHDESLDSVTLGKSITMKNGRDVCIVSTGNAMKIAIDAAHCLDDEGIYTGVESFHTVKPLDEVRLLSILEKFDLVCVLEEHSSVGGLHSAIAQWIVENCPKYATKFVHKNFEDKFYSKVGSQDEIRCEAKFTHIALCNDIKNAFQGTGK